MSDPLGPDPGEDDATALAVRDRRTPAAALERLAARPDRMRRREIRRLLAMHPNLPSPTALRLLDDLLWRDLVEVALGPAVPPVVRRRAEMALRGRGGELSLGERIGLARRSPRGVALALLDDADDRVLLGALDNPRLVEGDVLRIMTRPQLGPAVLARLGSHARWGELRAVRLAVAMHPRTPAALALRLTNALAPNDLRALAGDPRVPPLVRIAAERRLARGLLGSGRSRRS